MARTIEVIKQQIIDAKNADANLAGLTTPPSQTAIWNLWAYITAVCIYLHEVLWDSQKAELEDIQAKTVPGTPAWFRSQVLRFQYDSVTPQVATLNTSTFTVDYPIVDDTKRIVTRCSVKTDTNKTINVKVAKGEPPVQLLSAEQLSLDSFLAKLDFAGVDWKIINAVSDKIFIGGDVYYDGNYSAVIKTNVISALNLYLKNLSSAENFDGKIKISAIEDTIQSVLGVTDVKLTLVKARPNATLYANSTIVFDLANSVNNREYLSYAGYVVEETTSGATFNDTINVIPV